MSDTRLAGHGLTKENLLASLPPALMGDASMRALAGAVAEVLAQRPDEIDGARLYPRIGELDGPLLDVLAQDFKVDWWDSGYSLEEKRRTLQSSWQVHKTLGTKAAVERAASAVYPHTTVQEWFEYGGKPYFFKLDVGLPDGVWDPEAKRRLMWGLHHYKNLRSHMEAVEFHLPPVVLENRQAFYFSLLTVALWARNRGALALPRLLVGARVSGLAGTALALLLRAPVRTAERLSLARLALLFPLTEETCALLEGLRIQAGRACQSDFAQTALALLLGAWGHQAQSLALARMALLSSAAAETQARLDSLRIWAGWVRQADLTEAALALQGSVANPRCFAMPGFRAGFRERTASRVSLPRAAIQARAENPQSNTVYMTRTDLRWFNGTHQLNGTRRFNAGIKRSEL